MMNNSEDNFELPVLIGFAVPRAISEYDIGHVTDKVIGNPVYVSRQGSIISAVVKDRYYDGKTFYVSLEIKDPVLANKIDDKDFVACNYHYIDPVLFLTEGCH